MGRLQESGMKSAEFFVKDMDCGSEEQLIRARLAELPAVRHIAVDLAERRVAVFYEDGPESAGADGALLASIQAAMDSVKMGSRFVGTASAADVAAEGTVESSRQRRSLQVVLGINAAFFVLEWGAGYLARSMGLLADSLDMLADALVYGLALMAVSATLRFKKRVARLSGVLQMLLAVLGLVEIVRRFFESGSVPDYRLMMGVSVVALLANWASLLVLRRAKSQEVHIQASQIFTSNDMMANLGVIVAGLLVVLLDSRLPDLVIGVAVFALVLRGAIRILLISR